MISSLELSRLVRGDILRCVQSNNSEMMGVIVEYAGRIFEQKYFLAFPGSDQLIPFEQDFFVKNFELVDETKALRML